MKYETSADAAKRLSVTVRAVQKWAKEGKIPGACKQGRDWVIPCDAVRPGEEMRTEKLDVSTFPMIHSFEPGKALAYIDTITNKDLKDMALGEYYYFTGRLDEAALVLEPHLDNKTDVFRFSAAVFSVFSNLSRGHLNKVHFAQSIIDSYLEQDFDKANTDKETIAIGVFTATIIKLQLHLDLGKMPSFYEYVKYLSDDLKIIGYYMLAYKAYLAKDYNRSLGILEIAAVINKEVYPIGLVYVYIMAAMNYINLMDIDKAKACIENAWKYACPDNFIMPFVEHYSVLQGLIESSIKKTHPEFYKKIIDLTKNYNENWFDIYNEHSGGSIAGHLTNTEFTIAMLYSRNWRVKEIAAHMELSERTVTNYIQIIYEKLHINSKKSLCQFILS